MNLHTLFKFN